MSLPSVAIFVKDTKIVGAAPVNCGWFVNSKGMIHSIREALAYAKEVHDRLFSPKLVRVPPGLRKYLKYFVDEQTVNEDALPNFDYIWLYDYAIPRDIALVVALDDSMTDDEFKTLADSGEFAPEFDIRSLKDEAIAEKRNYSYWDDEE